MLNKNLKEDMNKDEKKALRNRVNSLKDKYSKEDIEKIIFTELSEIGLKSEDYLDLLESVLEEF